MHTISNLTNTFYFRSKESGGNNFWIKLQITDGENKLDWLHIFQVCAKSCLDYGQEHQENYGNAYWSILV